MKISKLLLGVAFLVGAFAPLPALADPPSYVWNRVAVCDPSNPLNCSKPTSGGLIPLGPLPAGTNAIGYVGGFNAVVSNTPTVQNAAYSASNAIGGWQQLSVFRNTTQPSGIVDYVSVASKGGSTTALTVYAFSKSSANLSSTCTDKSAFSLAAADLSALIPGFPVTLTPATTQGTTITSASQSVVVSAKNADGTPSTNITLCAVVGGSVTPASTSDLVFNLALVQD